MLSTLSIARPITVIGRAKRLRVTVTLTVYYLVDRNGLYLWGYRYRIHNRSDEAIVVKRRSWVAKNGDRDEQEVFGFTIVGERPIIWPGRRSRWFRTGVPLNFNTGSMRGTLHCQIARTGQEFDIDIPKFDLNVSNPGVVPGPRLRWAEPSTGVLTPGEARAVRELLEDFERADVARLATCQFPASIRYDVEDFLLREHLLNVYKNHAALSELNMRARSKDRPLQLFGCMIDVKMSDLYITDLRKYYNRVDEYGIELVKFGPNPQLLSEVDAYFAARAGDIMARRAADARLVAGVRGLLAASETSESTRRLLTHIIEGGAATVSRCLDAAENSAPPVTEAGRVVTTRGPADARPALVGDAAREATSSKSGGELTWPTEKWKGSPENLSRRRFQIVEFLRRVWKPFIEENKVIVTREILREKDTDAAEALDGYLRSRPFPKDIPILTSAELRHYLAERPVAVVNGDLVIAGM
jgi:uncharacterized protein affecting Mg2+/Co2+ transport